MLPQQEASRLLNQTMEVRRESVALIAALFVRRDSIYKTMPNVDAWDIDRDARNWPGGCPVVAHPPCRAWGRLRQFAQPREDEKALGPWAVERVRQWGGVLEHPESSSLWPAMSLPAPGARDAFGGWTLPIHQYWFGHRAEKSTFLYIVGIDPRDIPDMPMQMGRPGHCVRPTKSYPRLPSITKPEREHTPPALAEWLVALASRCKCERQSFQHPGDASDALEPEHASNDPNPKDATKPDEGGTP